MRFHTFKDRDKGYSRRCYLYLTDATVLRGELSFSWRNSAHLTIDLAQGDDTVVSFIFSFFFFFASVGLDNFHWHSKLTHAIKRPYEKYGNGREIGLTWYGDVLWINLWYDPMEHRAKDPKWWRITICPVDLIFGRTQYETGPTTEERVIVPMPEGGYPATVKLYEARWRRRRWPWVWSRIQRAEITPDTPIAFPGKGENSYDCGEDALFSLTCAAKIGLKAAMEMSESVMCSRLRHGSGWNYRPEKVWTK